MGNKKHSIDVLFTFVLFTIFAILSIMLIFIGSGVYGKISDNKTANEKERTTLSYMANKVKASNKGDNIRIEEKDGIEVLVIANDANKTETLIYEYDAHLMEMTIFEGNSYDLKFGDRLMKANNVDFELDKEKSLLEIAIGEKDNREHISVYLGLYEGGAL